jgi:hypothetical protein
LSEREKERNLLCDTFLLCEVLELVDASFIVAFVVKFNISGACPCPGEIKLR